MFQIDPLRARARLLHGGEFPGRRRRWRRHDLRPEQVAKSIQQGREAERRSGNASEGKQKAPVHEQGQAREQNPAAPERNVLCRRKAGGAQLPADNSSRT